MANKDRSITVASFAIGRWQWMTNNEIHSTCTFLISVSKYAGGDVVCRRHRRSHNNALEGWHRRLNWLLGRHYSNIWRCITILQEEQVANEVNIQQILKGRVVNRRRVAYIVIWWETRVYVMKRCSATRCCIIRWFCVWWFKQKHKNTNRYELGQPLLCSSCKPLDASTRWLRGGDLSADCRSV